MFITIYSSSFHPCVPSMIAHPNRIWDRIDMVHRKHLLDDVASPDLLAQHGRRLCPAPCGVALVGPHEEPTPTAMVNSLDPLAAVGPRCSAEPPTQRPKARCVIT